MVKLHQRVAKGIGLSHGKHQVVVLAWDAISGLDWAAYGVTARDHNIAVAVARKIARVPFGCQAPEMNEPSLTHLQFFVLCTLDGSAEVSGKDLRDHLRQRGMKMSGPGFYQFMGRLERSGFVKGKYTKEIINGQIIKQRRYQITEKGRRAMTRSLVFYRGY